jgi:hypothetical protein
MRRGGSETRHSEQGAVRQAGDVTWSSFCTKQLVSGTTSTGTDPAPLVLASTWTEKSVRNAAFKDACLAPSCPGQCACPGQSACPGIISESRGRWTWTLIARYDHTRALITLAPCHTGGATLVTLEAWAPSHEGSLVTRGTSSQGSRRTGGASGPGPCSSERSSAPPGCASPPARGPAGRTRAQPGPTASSSLDGNLFARTATYGLVLLANVLLRANMGGKIALEFVNPLMLEM